METYLRKKRQLGEVSPEHSALHMLELIFTEYLLNFCNMQVSRLGEGSRGPL